MNGNPASLPHKGPRDPQRVFAGAGNLRPVTGTLRRGENVCRGLARIFAASGCMGGVASFDGLFCDPLRYVGPARSHDPACAAYYSATFTGDPDHAIRGSTVILGQRDDQPFFHCHGLWQGGQGEVMGHLLPGETVVARDCEIRGLGCPDNCFATRFDPETNFTLFHPLHQDGKGRDLFLRLAPDQDLVGAVEQAALDAGLADARIHGLGSLCEPHFEAQGPVPAPITEVRIDRGVLFRGRAQIDVSMVDTDWRITRGRLIRGRAAVGVTFEVLLEATGVAHPG